MTVARGADAGDDAPADVPLHTWHHPRPPRTLSTSLALLCLSRSCNHTLQARKTDAALRRCRLQGNTHSNKGGAPDHDDGVPGVYPSSSPPLSPGSPLTYSPQVPMAPLAKPDEPARMRTEPEFHGLAGCYATPKLMPVVIVCEWQLHSTPNRTGRVARFQASPALARGGDRRKAIPSPVCVIWPCRESRW